MTLVTVSRYRRLTGDAVSTDGDVEEALADAQLLAEEVCDRPFESMARTETVTVDARGRVFPRARPITAAPEGWTIAGGTYLIGSTFGVDWLTGSSDVEITTTGGYTSANVPRRLERAIARIAQDQLAAPVGASAVPVGAKSVSVGDASVTFAGRALGPADVPGDAWGALRAFRRRL